MTQFVLSTMTNTVGYCFYTLTGDLPVLNEKITIRGGAGIPSTKSGFGEMHGDGEGTPMWTADGMITPISDEKYDRLKDHPQFKKHLDKGFVKVIRQDITGNHKEVKKQIQTMEKRDGFAQLNKDTIGLHTKVKIGKDAIDNDVNFN